MILSRSQDHTWADPEGGTGGPDPPWNCQIINFCHVEIFRQTPSGNLDPPPEKIFWIRACHKFNVDLFGHGMAHVLMIGVYMLPCFCTEKKML